MFSTSALPAELTKVDPDLPTRMQAMGDYMACRTAFFDEFFLSAADAGARQVVILAAGLDARAWRLPWPDGTRVYELDQPKVLQFKSSTLQQSGTHPKSIQVNVPVDLRRDWPKALQQAGFDPLTPSAWSAEGLLPFLPARAQDRLFDRIHALSAGGSWLAVEAIGSDFLNPDNVARQREQMQRVRAVAAKMHNRDIPDFADLWYFEERTDVADWLRAHGWDVSVMSAEELMARYERSVPEGAQDATPLTLFVSAQRSTSR
jgi:methyltransferase (TIGR00027 family)